MPGRQAGTRCRNALRPFATPKEGEKPTLGCNTTAPFAYRLQKLFPASPGMVSFASAHQGALKGTSLFKMAKKQHFGAIAFFYILMGQLPQNALLCAGSSPFSKIRFRVILFWSAQFFRKAI